jgi:hypothetical protein
MYAWHFRKKGGYLNVKINELEENGNKRDVKGQK